MNQSLKTNAHAVVKVLNNEGNTEIVLACEHASCAIPNDLYNPGLDGAALTGHAAWDVGAAGVAKAMSACRAAPLPACKVSRLACDCTRPPEAPEPMPALREVCEIRGNKNLSGKQNAERISRNDRPIAARARQNRAAKPDPAFAALYSLAPAFHGIQRGVEFGLLHDKDRRLADAMLRCARNHCVPEIRRKEPYGPEDGVTHTLRRHAIACGRPTIMSETRDARIAARDSRIDMATKMSVWITDAVSQSGYAA